LSKIKDVADYLATLKKEAEIQKRLFYKELFHHAVNVSNKVYGFQPSKEQDETSTASPEQSNKPTT